MKRLNQKMLQVARKIYNNISYNKNTKFNKENYIKLYYLSNILDTKNKINKNYLKSFSKDEVSNVINRLINGL